MNFERIEIDEPNYAEKGADGRSIFEDYVLSIICDGKKASVVRNIIKNRQHLENFTGASDAIKKLFKDRNYIDFYDYCRSHSPALKTNKSFSRFASCMKQWGLDDSGFFKELAGDNIRRSDLRKNKSLMKGIIDEATKPNDNAYVNALENLKVLRGLMPMVDKFQTNNREEIEVLLKKFYAR